MARRLFVDQPLDDGGFITLEKESSHYIKRVLRIQKGATLELFNQHKTTAIATIQSIEKDKVVLCINSKKKVMCHYPEQSLAVAVCAPQKLSWIIQKATELAVKEIWLLETEFSQNNASNLIHDAEKIKRYNKIIISACEQSGVNYLPTLHKSIKFTEWLEQDWVSHTLLLADKSGSWHASVSPINKPIIWLIGPEGGFSEAEMRSLIAKKAQSIKLSPTILRMETACISALTIGHQIN